MKELEGSHILIVDDTLKNIQVLGTLLRKENFKLNVAQNGQQALDSVERVRPDLILLDVMMPVMDGHETCRRLKANPETADIPVIFLTAKVEPEDIVSGFGLGAVDYVTKPFNSAELLSRVRTHLTINHLRGQLEGRIRDLDGALGQIERMYREHGAFLRHELNNAISPILGYADMLIRQPNLAPEKQSKWLGRIVSSAHSMQDLLGALKNLQEIERGEYELDRKDIDLERFIFDEVKNQETAFEGVVSVDFDSNCTDATVSGDAGFLVGVFRNLLKNAIEHVREIPEADRRVSVNLSETSDAVSVAVNNSGSPIPEDRLATFFEKFNSTKKGSGGTGLGTSFAHLVTEAHGGTMSVDSNQADGTTVTVQLPKA